MSNARNLSQGDTRFVNTSGDTMTGDLSVTSGDVGIGTSSPSSPLHVVGDSSGDFLGGGIRINDTNNSSDWFLGAAGSGSFQIAEAAGSTRLVIDTSGRVTMPNQPMVFVTKTSTQAVSNSESSQTTLDFTSEIFDINNNFNLTNDRFTAPVTGRYEISWSYGTNVASASVYRTFIWKNGSRLSYTQLRNDSRGTTGYVFGSRTAILPLNENDYIELRASTDNGTAFYADTNLRICMTIRLIG